MVMKSQIRGGHTTDLKVSGKAVTTNGVSAIKGLNSTNRSKTHIPEPITKSMRMLNVASQREPLIVSSPSGISRREDIA